MYLNNIASKKPKQRLKELVIFFYIYMILEGMLRKWFIPTLNKEIYFLKDFFLICIYSYALKHKFLFAVSSQQSSSPLCKPSSPKWPELLLFSGTQLKATGERNPGRRSGPYLSRRRLGSRDCIRLRSRIGDLAPSDRVASAK